MHIRFGPSGNSPSFYEQGYKSTKEQPKWLHTLGLDAFEYSFGRGVRITKTLAEEIGQQANLYDIQLSVHAPYYINLAAEEPEKAASTLEHFKKAAQACDWLGGKRIVFHPGAAGKEARSDTFSRTAKALGTVLETLDNLGFSHLTLCPETMGKLGQIGDLEETIELCRLYKCLIPCLDFGHLYARSLGNFHTRDDYKKALDKLEDALGFDRASRLHIHFSRIEFTKGGEKRHLNYEDKQFGPDFEPLAMEFFERQYTPVVISESKTHIAEDALLYKTIYQGIKEENKNECKDTTTFGTDARK